ncbi:xylulose kinase [Asanoa ishikariensis]|uniref:Sugar (Pentulose or hexulose) kinase n=1 Tax=Asanoa ishikariensis TaxID=137265 RepID=A0A1H3UFU7_9ACTN|nr:FGGY family carbohydrate kinase [Asanoa ishikariensis]GIF63613.1 xylulose kinase [Asanoa ishikariensis]SDZ61323.1 Sugar (pentulose or hexulose) kinase [Asanoa ishikariensis]
MTELVAGVDLGTTDTKAVLTRPDGETVAFARKPTTWTHKPDGRLETTGAALANDVLRALAAAVDEAEKSTGGPVKITGIGIAGLAESGVILDEHGNETSPVIAWFDERGMAELTAQGPAFVSEFPRRTGLPFGTQWSLPKLLWMRDAGIRLDHASRWLNMPEYVAYALTGERVSEPSLASRTGLLDQATGRPWSEALERIGVKAAFLPELLAAGQRAGTVKINNHALNGAAVTVAGHDHPVAAIGAGATGPEDLFNSCGTAEVLLRSVPRILTDDERSTLVGLGVDAGRHVLPGHGVLIGGMRSGLVMRRVLALVGADEPARRDELDRRWRPDTAKGDGVTVLPAAPHDNDVTLRLRDGAGPDQLWAATLAYLNEQTEALLAAVNSVVGEHRTAVAAGGWTRMDSVRTAKAAVIPRLRISALEQPGARGAAMFAACAAYDVPFDKVTRQFQNPAVATERTTHDSPK